MKATGIRQWLRFALLVAGAAVVALLCIRATAARASVTNPVLTITLAGDGSGTVTSDDKQIDCPATSCSATYSTPGAVVTLTAAPAAGSGFDGFSGCTLNTGTDSCTVTMTGDQTITAKFALPPPAPSITSPVNATYYTPATVPNAGFSCQADPNSTLQSCSATADGSAPVNDGGVMPTRLGQHTLTATATDSDGQSTPATATYNVADPPTAKFTAPADPRPFAVGSHEVVSFTCVDGSGGTGISSCTDSHGDAGSADTGSGSTGQTSLDTSAPGTYTITLLPRSADGLSGQPASYTYTVAAPQSSSAPSATSTTTVPPAASQAKFVFVAPPSIDARRPIQGAVYYLDEKVIVVFSCSDVAGGPGLQSCTGTAGNGRRLDTSKLGQHTFTVTGADRAGESTSETITYTVVPTTNRFAIRRVRRSRGGVTRLALALPGPGTVRVLVKAWDAASGSGRVVFARRRIIVRRSGALSAAVAPTSAGRRLLRMAGGSARGQMSITYRPLGGHPRTRRVGSLRL